jgi:drug/metabolite transporter (DMT)-like permease
MMSEDVIGKTLALSCAFIWAFAVMFFKRSGETMPPLVLNLFKSTAAGIVMLPLWYLMDAPMIPDTVTAKDLCFLAASGIAGIAIADTLFFVCLNKLGAGYYAIVDCSYSPSMILFSWLLLGEPLRFIHLLGACLVITGVLVVTSEKNFQRNLGWKKILTGASAGIGAVTLMVLSIVAVKPILDNHSAIMVTQCRMIPAVIMLHIISLFHKNRKYIYSSLVKPAAFRVALPGALLGNVLSMLAWITAFKYTDMGSASILNQMNVIFVVVLARLFFKEPLTCRRLLATFLGFCGAVIVLTGCG